MLNQLATKEKPRFGEYGSIDEHIANKQVGSIHARLYLGLAGGVSDARAWTCRHSK